MIIALFIFLYVSVVSIFFNNKFAFKTRESFFFFYKVSPKYIHTNKNWKEKHIGPERPC